MSVIYRAIMQVEDWDAVGEAPELFSDWLRWKLEDPLLELPEYGRLSLEGQDREIFVASGQSDGCRAGPLA